MIPQQSTAGGVPLAPKRERVPGRRDSVMELWASTTLTQREIAQKVGFSMGVVPQMIQAARKAGDERVKRGDALRGSKNRLHKPACAARTKERREAAAGKLAKQRAEARERVLEAYAATGSGAAQLAAALSMRRATVTTILTAARDSGCERYAQGQRLTKAKAEERKAARVEANRRASAAWRAARRLSPPEPAPMAKAEAAGPALQPAAYELPRAPYDPSWAKSAGVPLKLTLNGIAGPNGELPCPPAVARVFERLAAGGLHGAELLAASGVKGGLCARSFAAAWRPQLAAIGIQLNSRGDAMSMTRA